MFKSLDDSSGIIGHHTKVKIKGVVFYYISLLYGTIPKIIFYKKTELFHKNFSKKYRISNEELPPKVLKIGKELHEKEVEALFGLVVIMAIDTVTTMMTH
jgi:hypothetical protein